MAWNNELTQLNDVLAGLYPLTRDSLRVVDNAGLPKAHIAFRDKAIDNWHQILVEADRRGKVADLIRAALKDYPEDPFLTQAQDGQLAAVRGPDLDRDLAWQTEQPVENLEKIMGRQSTLLPISFLSQGQERARSVARIRLQKGFGSGFLVQNNLLVTNHHVLADPEDARSAVIQMNVQQTPEGLDLEPVELRFDPDGGFATSKADDWTVCRVKGDANADWGWIALKSAPIQVKERVIIIQHPGGGPKQIAFYHNLVTFVDDRVVQYLTDTLPGSSGSPVFDDRWRLVALHHSGGHIREPGSKELVFRNEGIRIERVLSGASHLLSV